MANLVAMLSPLKSHALMLEETLPKPADPSYFDEHPVRERAPAAARSPTKSPTSYLGRRSPDPDSKLPDWEMAELQKLNSLLDDSDDEL